ncbi:MAG: S41 family peptidase, partial [bacterium]
RFPYSAFWEYRLPEKPGLIQEKNYSIVNLGSVTQDNIDSIMNSAIKTNSIIFDLRNYPMITHFDLAKYLSPVIKPFYRAYEPSLIDIGIFKPAVVEKITIENGKKFNGKIIVIVNEFTQSRGEFLSMYLQSLPNTIIIGSQTAGTDGNLTQIKLPGNIYGGFTNIIVEYPDGTQTQKNGILIDHLVKITEDDIISNKDPYLEFAKEMANR